MAKAVQQSLQIFRSSLGINFINISTTIRSISAVIREAKIVRQKRSVVFDFQTNNDIYNIIRVAISPDGQAMLFDAKIGARGQIFRMNSDGIGLKQITNSDLDSMSPFWSLDGKSFYTVVYKPDTLNVQLTLYNLSYEVINTIKLEDTRL